MKIITLSREFGSGGRELGKRLADAAIATAIGQIIGGIVSVIYFARKNDSPLRLTKTKFNGRVLLHTVTNGSSEMITNLSSSVVNILYNFQLMKFAGENGVTAYCIIMYVNIVFMAIFLGYSLGSAPIISYHYGAENHMELKNLFRKSMKLLAISGVVLVMLSEIFTKPLVAIFAGKDIELLTMTTRGFQIAVILVLPAILGIDGIWMAIVIAELLTLLVTGFFLYTQKKWYYYA